MTYDVTKSYEMFERAERAIPGEPWGRAHLYASYYTSDVDWDPPWILGMFAPSAIKMARIRLSEMEALAISKEKTA